MLHQFHNRFSQTWRRSLTRASQTQFYVYLTWGQYPFSIVSYNSVLNVKALVGAFYQEKALVGAFSVIVKTDCETDGALHSTTRYSLPQQTMSEPQPWKFPYYYKMGHNITWRIISRGSTRFPYLWSCLLGNKISTYVLFLTEFGNHSQHPPANQRRLFSKTNGFNNKFYVKLLPSSGSSPPCTL